MHQENMILKSYTIKVTNIDVNEKYLMQWV